MSDRVAIIGGSEVGRDHFPFPVANGLLDVNSVAIDLSRACKWTYLVRTWDFEISFTWQNSMAVNTPETISFQAREVVYSDVDLTSSLHPSRESDLVRYRSGLDLDFHDGAGSRTPNIDDDVSGYSSTITTSCDVQVAIQYGRLRWDSGDFICLCTFGCRVGGGAGAGFGTGGSDGVGELDLDTDITQTFFRDDPGGAGISIVSASVTIVPSEFWSYAAKDGTPIYNTATGAQIQSPFN